MSRRKKPKKGCPDEFPSNADGDNRTSTAIAQTILDRIKAENARSKRLAGQVSGSDFTQITRSFVEQSFAFLSKLRPGKWDFNPPRREIHQFEQYHHLARLLEISKNNPEIADLLGTAYDIAPDVIVVRQPEADDLINSEHYLIDDTVGLRASIRKKNNGLPILHACISCEWTLRSDRVQYARSEALNLIRHRNGRLPHIVAVTGEPLPSRLASLALGTGDLDCVYHFALPELIEGVGALGHEDTANLVKTMVDGKRLKDIADLPLDLTV